MSDEKEAVDHPKHYNASPACCKKCGENVECIDVIEHMSLSCGNAVKYIWRAGEKDPAKEIEDLRKARWYIDREIGRLTRKSVE